MSRKNYRFVQNVYRALQEVYTEVVRKKGKSSIRMMGCDRIPKIFSLGMPTNSKSFLTSCKAYNPQ